MKKFYTLASVFILLFTISIGLNAQEKLIISEVADPANDFNARFIEIYNTGSNPIDFDVVTYYLSRQSNGGTTWGNIKLTGTISGFGTYIVANSSTAFATYFPGIAPNIISTQINGNGDDGYFIYKGGDRTTGTLIDAYGVVDEDGTGKLWEYEDSRALRKSSIAAPNATWTADEWTITTSANTSIFTPGTHQFDGAPNTNLSDLKVDGTTVTGFSSGILSYVINLPAGTTTVPSVTATAEGTGATVAVTPATNLAGAKADRTTSVEVTASDGTTKKTYTVRFDPLLEFSTISTLRTATEYDRLHKLTSQAVLTAQEFETSRNIYYIQDNTAAIKIDDPSKVITTAYNVGDGITGLKGTFSLYGGMLQFVPAEDPGAATATGVDVPVLSLTIPQFKADIAANEAKLVMLEDVTFSNTGTFAASAANYTIAQGTETTVLRTEFQAEFSGKTIPVIANVRGVAIVFNGTAQIAPRVWEDIMTATDIPADAANGIKLYPVPVYGVLNIEGIDAFTAVEIRDIAGRVYHSASTGGAWLVSVDTGKLPKGIYFVRLYSPAGVVTKKFIRN